jgi:hypothetical protein
MADIAVTAAQVAMVRAEDCEVIDGIAVEAIAKGQAVYYDTAGKVGVADANAAGKQQFRGIALKAASIGGAVPVLKRGAVYGFTVSGLNGDVPVFLSDTAGALADAAGTMTVRAGRIIILPNAPTFTKVVYIDVNYQTVWA